MRPPQGWEVVLILVVVVLLFGAKRLPDLARSVGKSLRILKDEAGSKGEASDTPASGSDDTGDDKRS
jgi:sec-independent protein translocase protein TatA